MKKYIKSAAVAATMALGILGFGATAASAATFTPTSATISTSDAIGTSWEVNFVCSAALPCVNSSGLWPSGTLAATVKFTLWGMTIGTDEIEWIMKVTLKNTSDAAAGGYLTALGFAVDPDANDLIDVWQGNFDSNVWDAGTGSLAGHGNTELCVWDGANCDATGNSHMTSGMSDSAGFSIITNLTDTLTFSDFAVKWAGSILNVAGNQIVARGYEADGTIPVAPVPLPAAGGMLLLGLGGLAMLRRGNKQA